MTVITDEFMRKMLSVSKSYTVVILKATPKRNEPRVDKILWEHARRNFSLREDGVLSVVCPIADESNLRGVGIFNADVEEAKKLMDEDPAVKTGILVYEIHPCRNFPGDSLPK